MQEMEGDKDHRVEVGVGLKVEKELVEMVVEFGEEDQVELVVEMEV